MRRINALPIDHPTRAARAAGPRWLGYCPELILMKARVFYLSHAFRQEAGRVGEQEKISERWRDR